MPASSGLFAATFDAADGTSSSAGPITGSTASSSSSARSSVSDAGYFQSRSRNPPIDSTRQYLPKNLLTHSHRGRRSAHATNFAGDSPSPDVEKKIRNPTPLGLIADEREIEQLVSKTNYQLQNLGALVTKYFNNPDVEYGPEDVPEIITGIQDMLDQSEAGLLELKQRIGILGDDANTMLQQGNQAVAQSAMPVFGAVVAGLVSGCVGTSLAEVADHVTSEERRPNVKLSRTKSLNFL
ncbi:unnamed protein product [Amoebophrya sp. A120]|nr:unnamed protein product [Amoebophrya sp. A120]|eukprot:GSA120T00002970001.1